MNKIDFTKIYNYMGKTLSALAGGVIGFILGGAYWIAPGIIVVGVAAHLLERKILKLKKNQ